MVKNTTYLILLSIIFTSCASKKYLMEDVKNFKKENHLSTSKDFMITSQGHYSSKAAKEVIDKGGNIIDAMAAISFVISVERPQSTGIGGGGFLLFYEKKTDTVHAFDFREKAPLRSDSKMYLDKSGNEIDRKSLDGIFAVGVPGLVKGVLEIHKKYGKLKRADVLKSAIDLARNGMPVYEELRRALKGREKVLCKYESSKKIFCPNGELLKEGEVLKQNDLANTLERISKFGEKDFYHGETMRKIVSTSKKYKGLLTRKDFRKYNVVNRKPISGTYKNLKIYSMSPPSSGGVHIIQILNILENTNFKKNGPYHPKSIHYVSSAMEMAFADRAAYLGDSDFVKVPLKGLTSKKYAKTLFDKIKENEAFKKEEISKGDAPAYESDHTTHFTIMDKEGNTVVSTQTINGWFGSGLVAEGTGIVLNNEMDDFSTKPGAMNLFGAVGSKQNLVAPEKRPLSSMSPTIVFKDGEVKLGVGTPSGTRILTCVMQTILNYFEYEKPLYEAVAMARYHHQWRPHQIRFDETSLPSSTVSELEKMGHKVKFKNLGCRIQAVAKEGDVITGVSDPRGEGKALGL